MRCAHQGARQSERAGGAPAPRRPVVARGERHAARGALAGRYPPLTRARRLQFPRYARVNRLKGTVEAAEAALVTVRGLAAGDVAVDEHIPDVLVLPAATDLHDHRLVRSGAVILQDKASCMPAVALFEGTESRGGVPYRHVIDACAAPGNKTSHVAALLGLGGKITAFEIVPRRSQLLRKRMTDAGATNVNVKQQSFLDADPTDPAYADVEAMLLDPSCSGSGMVHRLDHVLNRVIDEVALGKPQRGNRGAKRGGRGGGPGKSPGRGARGGAGGAATVAQDDDVEEEYQDAGRERLTSLTDFQKSALLHAMKFPNVRRISYSTCSVHDEVSAARRACCSTMIVACSFIDCGSPRVVDAQENEGVVAHVLAQQRKVIGKANPFVLRRALPTWHRRGRLVFGLGEKQANALVRVDPAADHTHGFFVAVFERAVAGDVGGPPGPALGSATPKHQKMGTEGQRGRSGSGPKATPTAAASKRKRQAQTADGDSSASEDDEPEVGAAAPAAGKGAPSVVAAQDAATGQPAAAAEAVDRPRRKRKQKDRRRKRREAKRRRSAALAAGEAAPDGEEA